MRIWKKKQGWVKPQIDKQQSQDNKEEQGKSLTLNLDYNLERIKKVMGNAQDLAIREITLASNDEVKAAVVAISGMADRTLVNEQVLKSLMLDIRFPNYVSKEKVFWQIKKYGITNFLINEVTTIQEVTQEIIIGNTVFLLDGVDRALVVGSRGWENRNVSEPATESVVRGPRDGFTENLRTNTALIRRRIKSPDLRIEGVKVGKLTRTDILLVYLEGVARKEVIDEVKNRLQQIKIDGILESGYIEELIEENPLSPFPQIEHSERPDKVSAAILEGRVAILVDTTPFVLIVPTLFFQFIQAAEDYYERFYLGSMVRWIRILAYIISISLPAIYISLIAFHQEMIPTPLALSFAASREGVPFPAIGEALLMEVTFEILREAGIRLPRPTGQAVSIVGALVIGEAAVQAGIVSQAMLIVVALTGISSFAIPAYNAAITARVLRFPLMISAAVFGLFGVLIGFSIIIIHMCGLRSFGVSYLDPLATTNTRGFKDLAIRSHWRALFRRPSRIAGADKKRL